MKGSCTLDVRVRVAITHPENRMRRWKKHSKRGGQWVDRISVWYLRRKTVNALFAASPLGRWVKDFEVTLNGERVRLEEYGSDGLARFTVIPRRGRRR